jgi:hypothetical protein
VSLHESLFNNVCEKSLSGEVIKDRGFLEMMRVTTGDAPRELWVHDRVEPWSVVAAEKQPVVIQFSENQFQLTARIQQINRGSQKLERPLEVTATYSLAVTPDGPRLTREGEAVVAFEQTIEPTREELELKAFAERKFRAMLKAEIYFDALVPPSGKSWEKIRQLQLKQLNTTEGWLILGYQLPEPGTTLAAIDSTANGGQ